MQDKDWRLMLRQLAQVIDDIILTRVNMERSADPYELAQELAGKLPYHIIPDAREALEFILQTATADDTIFVATNSADDAQALSEAWIEEQGVER